MSPRLFKISPLEFLAPMIVGCALFMEMLDSTVISTALPVMAKSLGEDPIKLNLAITSYLLSLAVFIPISGWMADRFGARTVFRAAIVIFTIGSILCGVSQSLPQLVAARIAQGFGGAMMVPVGRLIVLKTVAKSELVTAMSYLTVPAVLGPVVGPPIGGFIVTYYSWRWIFFINVPIGAIGITLITWYIPNIREDAVVPLDWRGFLLTGLGLAGLVFGFESIGRGVLPAGDHHVRDGRRRHVHGALYPARQPDRLSDHRPGVDENPDLQRGRRWAADFFGWASARCRFYWRCCCRWFSDSPRSLREC